ncbi:MAG: PDZ domain-containing protein [Planctomycetes bacterium]|nr:PDZ domain-containing protein [Planctomycetota bacterium]
MTRSSAFLLAAAFCAPIAFSRDFERDSAALHAIHEKLSASVVYVEAVVRDDLATGVTLDTEKSATGLVVGAGGLVMVPASIQEGALAVNSRVEAVSVFVAGGRRFSGVYLSCDREAQVAFVRVEDPDFPGVPVQFAAADQLRVGECVASLRLAGPNFGRVPYLDAFLVSGALPDPARCYLTTFAVSDYLGGPVVAMDGRVVGVVGWMNLGGPPPGEDEPPALEAMIFADVAGSSAGGREVVLVPASHVREGIAAAAAGAPRAAQARAPWLGVETQPLLPELAAALGVPGLGGVLITRILPDSPAERAGLEVSDLVHAVAGEALPVATAGSDEHALARCIAACHAGDEIVLSVLRGGERLDARLRLAERPLPAAEAESAESPAFGLAARDLVYWDRADLCLPEDSAGALVILARPTGFAGQGGLRAGDIVSRVNGEPVQSARGLHDRLDQAAENREEELVFFVLRGLDTLFVHVQPDWDAPAARAGAPERG